MAYEFKDKESSPEGMIDITKLKSAENCKGKLKDVCGPSGLIQLAKDGAIPHYILTNPLTGEATYWFEQTEVNQWYALNFARYNQGFFVQRYHFTHFSDQEYIINSNNKNVPEELRQISGLFSFPLGQTSAASGIYFLCYEGKIQYVGQAKILMSRISSHLSENIKKFSHVYFITCPEKQLTELEGALIRHFHPPLNISGISIPKATDSFIIKSIFENKLMTLNDFEEKQRAEQKNVWTEVKQTEEQ
jgi:hypothetical protein